VPEARPIAHGFDEMYHMLPYYAGVYAYDDPNLNPAWPKDDPKFMAAWKTVNTGEWAGKAGEPAKKVRDFTYPHLATIDTEVRNAAIKWKFLFTGKDTWLGPQVPLLAPAVYNLEWDPGEQYDQLFNGAAPMRVDFKSSPGRVAGPDRGWTLMYAQGVMGRHFDELKKSPNRRSGLGGRDL
jgi:hypothetical protein